MVSWFAPEWAVLGCVAAPALTFLLLGGLRLIGLRVGEVATDRVAFVALWITTFAVGLTAYSGLIAQDHALIVDLGNWYTAGLVGFDWKLQVDVLSAPLLVLAVFLFQVVALFSFRYVHRDEGYLRFFLLFFLFMTGMHLVLLAGSLDVLYVGWELVGISSALLVAFFQFRIGPVNNGIYTLATYKICDAALLAGVVLWHHLFSSSDLPVWHSLSRPAAISDGMGAYALLGVLVVVSSLGKSAQLPFSSWLTRAMEGPTPSSAIFYGALSVHAGAYLLLRCFPLFEASTGIRVLIACAGLLTALYAFGAGRTRSDVKSHLAHASMGQLGLIYIEIALGFSALALLHMIGHSLIRTLQFLRAPSILHDFHEMGMRPGGHRGFIPLELFLPEKWRTYLYRQLLVEGNLEECTRFFLVKPLFWIANRCNRFETGWDAFLDSPGKSPKTASDTPSTVSS